MPGKWARKTKKSDKTVDIAAPNEALGKIDHVMVSAPMRARRSTRINQSGGKWLLVAVVVVLAGLVGTGAYLKSRDDTPSTENKEYVTSEGVSIRKVDDDTLQNEVQGLIYEKKYTSAEELINFQDNAGGEKLQMLLTTVYTNQGAHDKALKVWQDMEQGNLGQKWQVQRNIGNEYEQMGDKANALVYYKKALETLKQTDDVPVKEDEIHFLERDIRRVET